MPQNTNGKVREGMPETEVVKKANRRQYTAEYKLRIVAEIDACKGSGHGRQDLAMSGNGLTTGTSPIIIASRPLATHPDRPAGLLGCCAEAVGLPIGTACA